MNRTKCLEICGAINEPRAVEKLIDYLLDEIAAKPEKLTLKNSWQYHAARMIAWIESNMAGATPFSIFAAKGNKKLPFFAFSSLAIADCPGRGECVNFCYSLKAWRYPAAFFRQLQNSLLLRFKSEIIARAFMAIPLERTVRLFVDGDFKDVETLRFFMDLCKARPDLACYGYSKSWHEFVTLSRSGYEFPSNYLTNASSGSRWNRTGIENAFLNLPCVRGKFEAVKVAKKHITSRAYQGKDKDGSQAYRLEVQANLRAALGTKKTFSCPGACGNCLSDGRHACGSKAFDGIAIGIGVH